MRAKPGSSKVISSRRIVEQAIERTKTSKRLSWHELLASKPCHAERSDREALGDKNLPTKEMTENKSD